MDRSARVALAALALCLGIGVVFYFVHEREQQEAAYARDDREMLADDDTGLRSAYAFLRKGGYRVALETPENARPPPLSQAWWIFQSNAEWFAQPEARAAEVRHFAENGGTVVIAPAEALTAPSDETSTDKAATDNAATDKAAADNADGEDSAGQTPADDGAATTATQKASDKFFNALGLDVHLLAFESPADDDDDSANSGDANSGDANSGDANSGDANSGDANSGDASSNDATRGDAVDATHPGTPAADSPQQDSYGYTLPVSGHGPHFDSLTYLQTSWGNFWSGEDLLKGEVRLETDGFPLVVEFAMGKGRVVLVAESTYFENEFLGDAHNVELLEALAKAYSAQGISLLTAR